jgi:hypothetical protein
VPGSITLATTATTGNLGSITTAAMQADGDIILNANGSGSGGNIDINGDINASQRIDIRSSRGNVSAGNLTITSSTTNAELIIAATGTGSSVNIGDIQVSSDTGHASSTLRADNIDVTNATLTTLSGDVTSTVLTADGSSGLVNVSGNMTAGTPSGVALLRGSHSIDGQAILSGNTVKTASDAALSAGFLQVSANTDIVFQNEVRIGTLSNTSAIGDGNLDSALVTNGLAAIGHTANAHLTAQSIDFQDIVLDGDYIYMAANDVSINGNVTVNGASPVVQIVPTLAANSMGFDETTAGGQDSNFLWANQLDKIEGHTLILGSTSHAGDAFLGSTGAIDIGSTNLLVLTSGSVSGFDKLTSTGVIGDVSGRINEPAPPPAPVADGIFETPLVDEIEDDSDDDDENDTVKAGEDADGDSDSSGQGITHRTAPETLECSV